jgi:hypothetical protein
MFFLDIYNLDTEKERAREKSKRKEQKTRAKDKRQEQRTRAKDKSKRQSREEHKSIYEPKCRHYSVTR